MKFILLGLLDVWVDKENMMKFLGKGSGIKGILISFIVEKSLKKAEQQEIYEIAEGKK